MATLAIGVVALAFYFVQDRLTAGGLTGGTTMGLWYGVIGSGMMIYAGLLSAHRKFPRLWWLAGPRRIWLRGHIWLGLLSFVFILCHAGFRMGGQLERLLWLMFVLTLVTGIFGLWLQQFLPRLLTLRVPNEVPYEQIPHVCDVLRTRADDAIRKMWSSGQEVANASMMMSQLGFGAKMQLQDFYERQVRPFLTEEYDRSSPLAQAVQAETIFDRLRSLPGLAEVTGHIDELEEYCEARRRLADQERWHVMLHSWLLLHIPLSVALLVLGVAHVVTALYY